MSTSYRGQDIIDSIRIMPDLSTIFNSIVAGNSLEPGLTILNETMAYMMGVNFPWKWNEMLVPPFYTNSYQQDYAVAGLVTLAWLQGGEVTDINNTAQAKAMPQVQVVRQLPRSSSWAASTNVFYGQCFQVCWLPNNQLYYGTWGAANTGNSTRGNNPISLSRYTNPLVGGTSQPSNPITQITDANGNLLVLTGYGTEGTTAPSAPANSAAGTVATPGSGATTVWTVVDPLGQGFRIWPTPTQTGTVWQFNLRGQAKPPARLLSLDTLLLPVPDEYMHIFRQGCITTSYRYSNEQKIRQKYETELKIWTEKLMEGRMQGDREPESFSFIASGGVVAPTSGTMPVNPGNPFGVPWGS